MSTFTWPEHLLPLPSHEFNVDVEASNVRSKMDSGRVRQRPRFTETLELSEVRFELTKLERKWFRAVWTHMLHMGNDWFTMRLPLGIDENEELTLTEVRFISDFKEVHRAFNNWEVSATIEYREPQVVSEDFTTVGVLYGNDPQQFQDEADDLETVLPVDWEY